MRFRLLAALLVLLVVVGLACNKASPVAPSGTTVTITANPTEIPASGSSSITVIARRMNGTPVFRGTQVRLQTNLGTIDEVVETDDNGVARAVLRGDGRIGTATVVALVGAADPAMAMVAIGATEGTMLTLSANPTSISTTGTSSVTIIARQMNGTPVFAGTQVRLQTTLGTIDSVVETDADGIARAVLHGDGRIGQATITATLGAAASSTVMVAIGEAGSITLQATPSNVPATGATISLLAVVRDGAGNPLVGALVNFQADVGALTSTGTLQPTDSGGVARDTLNVTSENINALSGARTFNVQAQVPGNGGTILSSTFQVQVQSSAPIADFQPNAAGQNRVFFRNLTVGTEPITFEWFFTSSSIADSTDRDPTFDFGTPGTYTVRLRATNSFGSDERSRTFAVPVQ